MRRPKERKSSLPKPEHNGISNEKIQKGSFRYTKVTVIIMNTIITIGRQFGSGGHEIGRLLAQTLGIPCYDHEIIEMIAKENGFDERYVANVSEKSIEAAYPLTIGHRFAMPPLQIMDQPIRVAAAQMTDLVDIVVTDGRFDDEALRAYENGEVQLSPGYIAVFEWKKGMAPNGEEYDIVMKEITDVNHLALLPNGRGGEYAVVLDNAPKPKTVFEVVKGSVFDRVRK